MAEVGRGGAVLGQKRHVTHVMGGYGGGYGSSDRPHETGTGEVGVAVGVRLEFLRLNRIVNGREWTPRRQTSVGL